MDTSIGNMLKYSRELENVWNLVNILIYIGRMIFLFMHCASQER